MRIGEVARRSGLSRDTIRFYERNGLISSAEGPEQTNSYRDYRDEIFERLTMIDEAQRAGFTISELRMFLRQIEGPAPEDLDMELFLDNKIREVEANIERATRFLLTLRATRNALDGSP